MRQVEKQTGKTPREIADAPALWPENRPAWRAFNFLCEGSARVTLSEIESYARIYGTNPAALAEKIHTIEIEFKKWLISQSSAS